MATSKPSGFGALEMQTIDMKPRKFNNLENMNLDVFINPKNINSMGSYQKLKFKEDYIKHLQNLNKA